MDSSNSSGKVLVIFLVITAILMISLAAISLFFFQKETEKRKVAEANLEIAVSKKVELEGDLKESKKQNFLLQEKNKEANERINDLSDDLELEKGLREEMRLESASIAEQLKVLQEEKETFAKEIEEKESLRQQLAADLSSSEEKVKELKAQLETEVERGQKLSDLYEQKQQEALKLEESIEEQKQSKNRDSSDVRIREEDFNSGIELEEIVVIPSEGNIRNRGVESSLEQTVSVLDAVVQGRILSIDVETEFVIVSLGSRDGLAVGNILSVYRDENYMGDIKITRLQSEMSAADLVGPLSIQNIQKNDHVKVK